MVFKRRPPRTLFTPSPSAHHIAKIWQGNALMERKTFLQFHIFLPHLEHPHEIPQGTPARREIPWPECRRYLWLLEMKRFFFFVPSVMTFLFTVVTSDWFFEILAPRKWTWRWGHSIFFIRWNEYRDDRSGFLASWSQLTRNNFLGAKNPRTI